ncbi:MAG TPA: hypothetical protein VIV11_42445 [Kofleriaceae bacterium]
MGRLGATLIALALSTSVAHADEDLQLALADRWRDVPPSQRLKLSQQITDELTELGNFIGTHVNTLSDDILMMRFDGRKRYARIRFGTGEGQYLRFKFDSDWYFAKGKARVAARVDLGIGKHQFHLELPEMDMVPASYRGERGVEIRLPLFERRW